jgi:sensor domain CHASE-containing protein
MTAWLAEQDRIKAIEQERDEALARVEELEEALAMEKEEAERRVQDILFQMDGLNFLRRKDNEMFIGMLRQIATGDPIEGKKIAQQYIAELER